MGHEPYPEVQAIIDDLQREMWAVAFRPVQDAPALGYMPSLREYVGAVPWTDEAISDAFYINRPPGVMLPSEVTDAVAKWWLRP